MAGTHFLGPIYSTNGFIGNLTGGVTITGAISGTSLTSTGALSVATTSTLTGVATFAAQPIVSTLTASSAVATDASKGLVSVTNTGTGNNVLAISPTITGTPKIGNTISTVPAPVALNATGALTGAQIVTAGGYITTVSTTAVAATLPTGTDLGGALGATAGSSYNLIFDNTGSSASGVVTITANTNAILSAAGAAGSAANFGLVTVPVGVTGMARFTLLFTSATAYTFTRTA